MMQDLEKRKNKQEFEKINIILKEMLKQLKLFIHFKDLKMTIFTFDDAKILIDELHAIVGLIKADNEQTEQKIRKMSKYIDEEEMAYLFGDMEIVHLGLVFIQKISGMLMQYQGFELSDYVGKTLLPIYSEVIIDISGK